MNERIPVPPKHLRNHSTHHEIVGYGQHMMELEDIRDVGPQPHQIASPADHLGTIASATRSGLGGKWTVKITRDPSFSVEVDTRDQAIAVMINHGPEGVADCQAGYATFVPHAVAQLP